MTITQVSTSSCSTTYDVDGVRICLWIITGGEPALGFPDYSFSERYSMTDTKWAVGQEVWAKNACYPHQLYQNPIQGPTYDVLPEGIETIKKFLAKYIPLKELRMKRIKALPFINEVSSKKFLDREEGTKVNFKIRLDHFGPLTASSKVYSGRCEREIQRLAPEPFKKYANYANPIFDNRVNGRFPNWEDLTEEQFSNIVSILQEIKDSGNFR